MTTELKYVECPECDGTGEIMIPKMYPSGHTEVMIPCDVCAGKGEIESMDFLALRLSDKI